MSAAPASHSPRLLLTPPPPPFSPRASLEREAYHVARELKDLQEKQLRLQERAAKP